MALETARRPYQATYLVLAFAIGGFSLLQSLVIPVLPTIEAGLRTSQNSVTWVLTAYLLSAAIFTPIMGRLGDMYGKERLLVIALAALTLGSLLAAVANSITLMIAARAIQGIGGGVLPLSFGLVRDEFPAEKVRGAIGVIAALAAAGGGLGIVLAGPIVDAFNYHWLFWIPMVVLAIVTIAAHVVVPESDVRTPGKLSWSGIVLLSTWLVALILAISEAPTWGWGSTSVVALLIGAVVVGAVWIFVEARSAHPLVDMHMMRIPAVWTINLVSLLLGVGLYAVFAFLPEFLQTPQSAGYGFGVSITISGLILLPMSVFMFAFGMLSGRLSNRYGGKTVLLAGLVIGVVTLLLLTFARAAEWEILLAMVAQGSGFGLAFSSMSALVVVAVPPDQTGIAAGMNANIRTIGGSIGAAAMSSIVTSGVRAGQIPRNSSYTHGFALLSVAAIAAVIAALFIPGQLRSSSGEAPMSHGELGMVAGGTLVGDGSE